MQPHPVAHTTTPWLWRSSFACPNTTPYSRITVSDGTVLEHWNCSILHYLLEFYSWVFQMTL